MIPKKIYFTYKKQPPAEVFERWKNLNPDYEIDFSLDDDCRKFLADNFDQEVADRFDSIRQGMHRADLWRMAKLYINGGIYADIDIVPRVPIDDLIISDRDIFYSCLAVNKRSIFQAFFMTPPHNPLLLDFLLSFLRNKPYSRRQAGPTFDMYDCLKKQLNTSLVRAENELKMKYSTVRVAVGRSEHNTKIVNLYSFPHSKVDLQLAKYKKTKDQPDPTFDMKILDHKLFVTRTDTDQGWQNLIMVKINIQKPMGVYLFPEEVSPQDDKRAHFMLRCFVSSKGKKILDSKDPNYFYRKY